MEPAFTCGYYMGVLIRSANHTWILGGVKKAKINLHNWFSSTNFALSN
jgi:hypothetical protein